MMGFGEQGVNEWKEGWEWNMMEGVRIPEWIRIDVSVLDDWFPLFHRLYSILYPKHSDSLYLKQLKVKEFSTSASEYRNKCHKRAGSSHSCWLWLCGGSNHRKTLSHTIYNDYSSYNPSLAYCLRRIAVNCWRQFGHCVNKWSGIHGSAVASPLYTLDTDSKKCRQSAFPSFKHSRGTTTFNATRIQNHFHSAQCREGF